MGCCLSCIEEEASRFGYERIPDTPNGRKNEPILPSSSSSTAVTTTKAPLSAGRSAKRKPLRSKEESQSEPIIDMEEKSTKIGFPKQFGQFYDVGTLVGVGTTSKVYRVYHRINKLTNASKQPLACKVIDKRGITVGMDDTDIEPLLEQLRKEVDILRRIHHQNIVSFVDFMETSSKLFIITERLDGGELFDHLLNNGPLTEQLACQVLHGVFSAVAYLHERGVIHRDIKAENLIFFHNTRGELSLKLIDFGFSTILGHDMTGSFMGTGGYIAPEIRQNKTYSTSVDSWSLGVLLYCTLSAKLPFTISIDALPSSTKACREAFSLVFPPQLWCHISETCKDLISSLLEIDPIKRITARTAVQHPWFHAERERQEEHRAKELLLHRKQLNQRISSSSKAILGSSLESTSIYAGTQNKAAAEEGVNRIGNRGTHGSGDLDLQLPVAGGLVHATLDGSAGGEVRTMNPALPELPALHSKLRPSRSTFQLERKFSDKVSWTSTASSSCSSKQSTSTNPRHAESSNENNRNSNNNSNEVSEKFQDDKQAVSTCMPGEVVENVSLFDQADATASAIILQQQQQEQQEKQTQSCTGTSTSRSNKDRFTSELGLALSSDADSFLIDYQKSQQQQQQQQQQQEKATSRNTSDTTSVCSSSSADSGGHPGATDREEEEDEERDEENNRGKRRSDAAAAAVNRFNNNDGGKSVFAWRETHDPIAGELFFTTYKISAATNNRNTPILPLASNHSNT